MNKNKPVILQNSGVKILVGVLCLLSFVAGYFAHQSRRMNYCNSINQTPIVQNGIVICQLNDPNT
ncbi:hypothetical protein [Moraxella catarrhalis]|uniref:hypothetical protein n=1 Tax=Moraxella catarrhalis TaxID=480 RepID=UPI000EA9F7B9|nr:hypothetical protein [Moraxella catarrhalis]RKL90192.1 hypothetical protein D6D56_06330 [Moraxella catarrhalis]